MISFTTIKDKKELENFQKLYPEGYTIINSTRGIGFIGESAEYARNISIFDPRFKDFQPFLDDVNDNFGCGTDKFNGCHNPDCDCPPPPLIDVNNNFGCGTDKFDGCHNPDCDCPPPPLVDRNKKEDNNNFGCGSKRFNGGHNPDCNCPPSSSINQKLEEIRKRWKNYPNDVCESCLYEALRHFHRNMNIECNNPILHINDSDSDIYVQAGSDIAYLLSLIDEL